MQTLFHALALLRVHNRPCGTFAKFRISKRATNMENNKSGNDEGMAQSTSFVATQPASTLSLNVLQNGSFGFYRSVYLAADTVTYMFNCPASNRRLFAEQGLRRPPSIKHVFVTHGSWQNVGGLSGLTALLKSLQVKELKLHGPPGLNRIAKVAQSFDHPTKLLDQRPALVDDGIKTFEDTNLIVECVPFTTAMEKEETIARCSESSNGDLPVPANEVAVAYICTLKPKWGKVVLEKCLELGVQIGPAIGLLQRGQIVKNRHGESVNPDQVREPPFPPEYFAIVECPDERFLDGLLRSTAFSRFSGDNSEQRLKLIVHFSPKRIQNTETYQKWMRQFPSTIHWICNDSSPPICHLDGIFRQQMNLNTIHSELFPLLWHHQLTAVDNAKQDERNDSDFENVVLAEPFTKYSFRPADGFQPVTSGDADSETNAPSILPIDRISTSLDNFRSELSSMNLSGESFPSITFLGTASAQPTKYRNVSGILLDIEPGISLLMDCGESTVSQLQLRYGPDSFLRRLLDIKAVFISHLHLDHHFGLYSLILERKIAFDKLNEPYENLLVLAASPLFRAHNEFSKIVEDTLGLCDFYSTAQDGNLIESLRNIADRLRLDSIDVVKVIHPQCATGIVLMTKDGKKIVYSGDTRPCQELVNKGLEADLLIHEATLNDGSETGAVMKKHCTKSEAINVSKAMRAKWTILTHFTGQNTKVPYVDERILRDNPTIGMAYDFMTVRWEHLPVVPKLSPVLYEMYIDSVEEQKGSFCKKRICEEMDEQVDAKVRKV